MRDRPTGVPENTEITPELSVIRECGTIPSPLLQISNSCFQPVSVCLLYFIAFVLRLAEFLSESDEKPFRPADVAEPTRVLIPDYLAYELCAALAKLAKRLVDVVHGEQ